MKKCAFCWFFLHMYIKMHGSENANLSRMLTLLLVPTSYGFFSYLQALSRVSTKGVV